MHSTYISQIPIMYACSDTDFDVGSIVDQKS